MGDWMIRTHTVRLEVFQDDVDVRGNALASGDDAVDRECEDEILERLSRGDVWAWCTVVIECTCDKCGATGRDSLGCCSYADEKDFSQSGYYADMCDAALAEMRESCICYAPEGIGGERCI